MILIEICWCFNMVVGFKGLFGVFVKLRIGLFAWLDRMDFGCFKEKLYFFHV